MKKRILSFLFVCFNVLFVFAQQTVVKGVVKDMLTNQPIDGVSVSFENSELIIETTKKIEILTKQIVIQSKSLDEIERLASEKEKLLAAIPSIQPIKRSDLTRMASGYGYRTDPFTKIRKFHYYK